MNSAVKMLNYISKSAAKTVTPAELQYMAYTGQYDLVYSALKEIPESSRFSFLTKDVLNQAIWSSIEKINKLRNYYRSNSVDSERQSLTRLLDEFIIHCSTESNYPREFFESLNSATDLFIQLCDIETAEKYLQQSIIAGVSKFPLLKIDTFNKLAQIYSSKGEVEKSLHYLNLLAQHPYLITNKNQIAEILFNLSQTLIKAGEIQSYSDILFTGLAQFFLNLDLRKKITEQIRISNKRSVNLLLNNKISISKKMLYTIHWIYFKIPDFGRIKLSFINRISSKLFLGIIYTLNYVIKLKSFEEISRFNAGNIPEPNDKLRIINHHNDLSLTKNKKILITRAMGGIGDLLMMTPGFHQLKLKYPDKEIHLAIPKRYFPVFENNPDVKLIDIEDDSLSHYAYQKWINFSECPAARVESRTAPKVKKSRIDLFAKGLGLSKFSLSKMDTKPRLHFTEDETEFANLFWDSMDLKDKTVIGIQIHSDESYRDYPHMEKLVKEISTSHKVIVFDGQKIKGYDFENVIKIDSVLLRQAFSIANKCDVIIGPDSSFIHFAAAFDKPTIALFGPIDGSVRTMNYLNCVFIDVRDELGCLPCWRNESMPCKLTGMRNSICMESIKISKVVDELNKIIERKNK
jgi:ADP-heptose:LPS heptosyltransferase